MVHEELLTQSALTTNLVPLKRIRFNFADSSLRSVDADKTHLDGSSSEVGELFDVLALLADQGPNCLSWNKEVDNLLLLSLLLRQKKKDFTTLLNLTTDDGREKQL